MTRSPSPRAWRPDFPGAARAAAGTLAASEGRWKSMRKSPLGGGGGSGASSQAACLKQILLLQLDLIEHRDGVSREVPCSALKGETVPDSLPAPPLEV